LEYEIVVFYAGLFSMGDFWLQASGKHGPMDREHGSTETQASGRRMPMQKIE
jgi:hypothetical protein